MPRNRQLSRLVHVSRRRRKSSAQADPPMPRRRALRRYAVPAAAAALLLIVTQVVLAVPPGASFTFSVPNTPTPTVPDVGETVRFDSSLADTDTGQTYTYQWDFGDGGTSTEADPSHAYSSRGEKTVTLTVSDSGGETDPPVSQTLRVNAPPSASVSCSPSTLSPNQATTCNSTGPADPEGAVTYAWDIDGDGFDDGTDASEQFSFATPGARTIRLRVTDSDSSADTAQDTVTVSNVAPTARFTFMPQNPTVNQTVNFDGSGSTDPEGQQLTFAWALDGDGQFDDGSGPTASRAFTTGGSKTVQLRVTDPQGNSHTATDFVMVTNRAPTAGFTFSGANSVTPAVPDVNEPITFRSTSTDPDGNATITSFEWDLDYVGTTFTVDRVGNEIQHSYPTAGTRRVALRVTDSSGAQSNPVAVQNVRVNALPTASFTCSPANPAPNEPIACNGSGSSDPEGAVAHAWDIDGDGFDDGGDVSETFSFPTAGAYTIRLRVTDSDGATSIPAERVVPVGNTAPTATISAVTPLGQANGNVPHVGRELRFEGSGSDLNGDNLSYSWDFGDGQTAAGSTVTHAYSSPGNKTVTLTVFDGTHTTPATTQVIVNALPRAGFTVAPENAFVDDNVTLSSTSADPDGPLTAQEWDLDNDGEFDDANAAVVTARFVRAGTYPLKLRVTDSRGATTMTTGQVTVNNRPIPPLQVLPGVEIDARFLVFPRRTKIRSLRVRAPAGSKINVRCVGEGCPKPVATTSKGSKRLRFKKLERRFRPKTKLIVKVTKSGFIGKQTVWTMRRRKPPLKRNSCLFPGVRKASACPSG
jgi:large repetitive protein